MRFQLVTVGYQCGSHFCGRIFVDNHGFKCPECGVEQMHELSGLKLVESADWERSTGEMMAHKWRGG